ncbi:MAG: EMC3/TMCO1 family protein [Candidatus Aenigmatarchaeota archaeon]
MIFNGLLNFLFLPILNLPPQLGIFIISLIFTSIMVYVNKKFLWTKEVKELQKNIKEIDKKIEMLKKESKKKFEKESPKLLKKQSDYMSKYMKHTMKPLIISVIIALIIIPWLNENYKNAIIFIIPSSMPLIGGKSVGWIWWYVACSLTISIIGKLLVGGVK